ARAVRHAAGEIEDDDEIDGLGRAVGGLGIVAHRRRPDVLHADRDQPAVGAVIGGIGGVGDTAVGVERDSAVLGGADGGDAERIVLDVAVVGEDAVGCDGERLALNDAVAVVAGDRRVVHRRERQVEGRLVEAAVPVGHGIGEAVGAVVVLVRRVDDGAV